MVLQVVAENVERARSETMAGFLKHGHKNWHSLELAAIQDRDLLSGSRVDEPRLNHINLYARQTQGQRRVLSSPPDLGDLPMPATVSCLKKGLADEGENPPHMT